MVFVKSFLDFNYFGLVSLKEKQMITGLLYVREISVEHIVSD